MDRENGGGSWPTESAGSWFVIRTRSRQERILARHLRDHRIAHFLPMARVTRDYAGYQANVESPVFPGYVFLRGTLDDVHAADRTNRVAEVLPVPDQRQLNAELRNLQTALLGEALLTPFPFLRTGVQARVREGPFAGLEGVIEGVARRDRIILQVQPLGRAVSLEVRGAMLEVIREA